MTDRDRILATLSPSERELWQRLFGEPAPVPRADLAGVWRDDEPPEPEERQRPQWAA